MKILLTILLSLASVSEAKSSKRRSRRSHSYDEISSSKLEQTKAVRDIYKIMSRHRKTDRAFSCFRYQHGNRGSLSRKTGYVKGMVLSMVRSQCRSKDDLAKQYMLKGRSSRSDALFKYRKSDEKTQLIESSLLSLSLGLWESSGKYYAGRDITNASSNKAQTAEAGLFQTSQNVHYLGGKGYNHPWHKALDKLEAEYASKPGACMTDVFSQSFGISRGRRNVGSGSKGLRFQRLLKSCPAAAAEHIKITMRYNSRHYGPLRKFRRSGSHTRRASMGLIDRCRPMFKEVYAYAEKNKETACGALALDPSKFKAKPFGPGGGAPLTIISN